MQATIDLNKTLWKIQKYAKAQSSFHKSDIPGAARQLNQIRLLMGSNTQLSMSTIITATAGKYYLS